MKIAIVHEWLTIYGGSERVVEALHELYPNAPIYCLVYDAQRIPKRFQQYDIRPTFLQKVPLAKKHYQMFLPLMPYAYEQLDLTDYDVVLVSSSACAKGVITRSNAIQICYCHTPIRYAWEFYYDYIKKFGKIKKILVGWFIHHIRIWDRLAADRVDYFVANSHYIQQRIFKYYRRESTVIFPPVNTHLYQVGVKEDFYLIVSRLVTYKRVELAVQAFNQLGLPLVIIGDGGECENLQKQAKANIRFLGRLSDEEVADWYSRAKAFVFCGEEDFGITPVEAQAAGTPVIDYGRGGILDTVIDGKTGIYFKEATAQSLCNAVQKFEQQGVSYTAEQINEWLKQYPDLIEQDICIINGCQITIRQGELNYADKAKLFAISEKSNNMNYRAGAFILLEYMDEAEKIFSSFNDTQMKEFSNYPIYNLYQRYKKKKG